jgi:hypothetical protein
MGVDPAILLWSYTALIRSHTDMEVLLFHSRTKGQMDLLEEMQCKTIRLEFGYVRMTPKNVMLAEAKIPPITFQLKFLGSKYLTRALSNPDHPVIQSLQQTARVRKDPTKLLHLGSTLAT